MRCLIDMQAKGIRLHVENLAGAFSSQRRTPLRPMAEDRTNEIPDQYVRCSVALCYEALKLGHIQTYKHRLDTYKREAGHAAGRVQPRGPQGPARDVAAVDAGHDKHTNIHMSHVWLCHEPSYFEVEDGYTTCPDASRRTFSWLVLGGDPAACSRRAYPAGQVIDFLLKWITNVILGWGEDKGGGGTTLSMFREVLDDRRAVLGVAHSDTIRVASELSALLERRGKYDQAHRLRQGRQSPVNRGNEDQSQAARAVACANKGGALGGGV